MYKVLEMIEYDITRDIIVQNEETGTIDECFDDTDIAGKNCFEFVKQGKLYDFKIALFGVRVDSASTVAVKCQIKKELLVGDEKFFEVLVGKDVYYVYRKDLPDDFHEDTFFFYCTRKDLIQVDDVIYPHLFNDKP